ncbi:MAG: cytochrome c [Anaerolineae bacterium]|nr:cytochrome c [Thermoflexales bacterium]MDW8406776.1 cytochrome c [Anaerolineae bacterium]
MNKLPFRPSAVALCAAAAILAGCTMAGAQTRRPVEELLTPAVVPTRPAEELAPPAPPDVARGAVVYANKCAACHGDAGMADGPRAAQVRAQGGLVPRLTNIDTQRAVEPRAWFDLISRGRIERLMPGFAGSLSAQERWDVLAYVWALAATPETIREGQMIYSQQCAACHGAQGRGDGAQAGGQPMASFVDPRWLAETSLNEMMRAMSAGDAHANLNLNEAQQLAAAQAIRTFGYVYADAQAVRVAANSGDGMLMFAAVNRTPGGAQPANLPVTLRVYNSEGEVFSRTERLDDRGVVTFTDLAVQSDYFYQPEIIYQGARFFAAPVQFTATRVLTDILPVYDVTTDTNAVTISELHIFVQDVRDGFITLVEFYLFDNLSDRAYVSQPGAAGQTRSVKISVPKEALNLRFDGPGIGARFVREGDILYDMDAVGPGLRSSSITMIYDVPYQGSRLFERTVYYPVARWDVLIPEMDLRAVNLLDRGAQQLSSGSIRLFEPADLRVTAGAVLRFELAGQPRGAPVPGEDARAVAFGLIALAAALAAGYVLVWRTRRQVDDEAVVARERQRLLMAIAELDRQHEAGRLKDNAYRKRRAALKHQLRDIWE